MRSFFTLVFGLFITSVILAQPANDDCNGLIDLGNLPACTGNIYTNVDANASNVGTNNVPTCFNGGTTLRDVWFAFTATDDITEISILLDGVTNGPNGRSITNPQIALYRGDCAPNNLSELACVSADPGSTNARLDYAGLIPNAQYFIRVNDYSASAASNAGDFRLCVQEAIAEFNMGEASGSTACRGTLYDSGGPDGNYGNLESFTFTICPSEPTACINIDLISFDIEPILLAGLFGDQLNFYAGDNTNAPLIATLYGQDLGTGFQLQSDSDCITVELISDFLATFPGFELNWECSATPCDNRSVDNPVVINAIPFQQSGLTTCESAATFATTPCSNDLFINGPEYVFTYNSPGDECIGIEVNGAAAGTGILILNGLPSDEGTTCVAQAEDGSILAANLRESGTYYIVVANANGCTPFDINISQADCSLSPALVDALCNPLNGCVRTDGLPTVFDFEDGFQDIEVEEGVNGGCWVNSGLVPNYYWFTIQAQADGDFGFIIESANEEVQSDLDFNVWGPFNQEDVCGNKSDVIAFIRNNQPIRSSWSPTPGATGLANVHPLFGNPVTDEYDCGNTPGADGDDFVRTIEVQEGEVYVVLINDWGDLIGDEGVAIDWSPSDAAVLDAIPAEIIAGDTSLCNGESVQIEIQSPVDAITWLNDTNTLSCDDCPNPVASPTETTTYRALVDAFCYNDTIEVTVQVYDLDAGPDLTVCLGEQFELIAGEEFDEATYQWMVPNGINLSCTDCRNPMVQATNPGTYTLTVSLTAPNCNFQDQVTITVLPQSAPQFEIIENTAICRGDSIDIGGMVNTDVNYQWTSVPAGFSSTNANPRVAPQQTTTYFLEATNAACPQSVRDSVTISVSVPPFVMVAPDTSICQEEPILLSRIQPEAGVMYQWTGPETIEDPTNPNTLAFPMNDGDYILTATRGACEIRDTMSVDITPIDVEIQQEDTVMLCLGDELALAASVTPATATVFWTPNDGSLSDTTGVSITATPRKSTMYYATVNVGSCVRVDSVFVQVDSLPTDLAIMPSDTSICEGSLVILTSPLYEPKDFMNIEFLWVPGIGQQTPDSLYNMVAQPTDTVEYMRITTSGACVDTATAVINVKPIPQLQIVPSDTLVCPGEQVDLTVIGPEGLEKPMWMPPSGLSCTECFDPTATVSFTTQYQFMAELNGCPGMAATSVRAYPNPQLELNTQTEICLGESIQLNFVAIPGIEYTWTSPDDPGFSSMDPFVEVAPTETTTYTVVAQAPNCDARLEADITIVVVPPSDVTVSPDQQICLGESVTLTADGTAPEGATETYAWRWNGQTAFGPEVTIDGLTEDTQVELTYVFGGNCGAVRKVVNIDVLDNIIVSGFAVSPEEYQTEGVPSGDMVTVTVETIPASPAGVSYSWTANGQPIGGNSPEVQHEPTVDPTVYEVTIVTANGCTTTESITLAVAAPQHIVPNAFTPNGDGRNDFFNVVSKGTIEIIEFRVYNRWGKLIYDNEDPTNGWDGTDNGNPAPSDVYVYYIVIRYPDGQEFVEQGDVTLIR